MVFPDPVQLPFVHLLEVQQGLGGRDDGADDLIQYYLHASVSRFCVFWIWNTMGKVLMVVVLLITSCQLSL